MVEEVSREGGRTCWSLLKVDQHVNSVLIRSGFLSVNFEPVFCFLLEYMVTMFDTKTQELRWNATYNDYSAPPYDDKQDYSTSPTHTRLHTPPAHTFSYGGLCRFTTSMSIGADDTLTGPTL